VGSWGEELVEAVLRRQERFGANIAFTPDYPLPPRSHLDPNCCPAEVLRRVRLTALGAALAYQLRRRGSMKLLIVLQYNSLQTLQKLLEQLAKLPTAT